MVQSLTPFRYPGRQDDSPLAGISDMEVARSVALKLGLDRKVVNAVVDLTHELFAGRVWQHHPIDLTYHDLAHTSQASKCFLDIAAGYARIEGIPGSCREFEVGFAAIALHDSGFLKVKGDDKGTGAKYTHSHVLRSCALAASLLPTIGFTRTEVEDAVGMIRCTGLTGKPEQSVFSQELSRKVACMVPTADYIGQMAAPDYYEKLPRLFDEFEEADDFSGIPRDKRMFRSTEHLMTATKGFWLHFVRPKLENDFGGVYRYLALPHPARRNPYLDAIDRNVVRISQDYPA